MIQNRGRRVVFRLRFRRRDGVNVGIATWRCGFQKLRHPPQCLHHVVPPRRISNASDPCLGRSFALGPPPRTEAPLDAVDESDQFACVSAAQPGRTALEGGSRLRFDETGNHLTSRQTVRVHRDRIDQKWRGLHFWRALDCAREEPLPRGHGLTVVDRFVQTVFPEALEDIARAGNGAAEAGKVVDGVGTERRVDVQPHIQRRACWSDCHERNRKHGAGDGIANPHVTVGRIERPLSVHQVPQRAKHSANRALELQIDRHRHLRPRRREAARGARARWVDRHSSQVEPTLRQVQRLQTAALINRAVGTAERSRGTSN